MRHRTLTLLVAACLCACTPKTAPQTAFDAFIGATTTDVLSDAPEFATQAGLSPAQVDAGFASRLDDRSSLALELRRGAALRRYAQIRAVDRATLRDADAVTFDAVGAQFAAAAAGARFSYGQFSQLGGFSPYVLNHISSAFVTLPGFFEHDIHVTALSDGEDYLRRLSQVAGALDAEIERARADARLGVVPPSTVLDRAAASAAAFVGAAPDDLPYVRGLRLRLEAIVGALPVPPATDTPAQARARALLHRAEVIAVDDILPAYRRTNAAIADLRARANGDGVWRLPQGDAYYRAALAAATGTTMSPGAIHALGLKRVKQVSGELDMMLRSQGLTEGSVGQRLAQLTSDARFAYPATPEGRAAALADIDTRLANVGAKLRGWFSGVPDTELEVRAAPDYAVNSFAGGYYEAPPLNGRAAGAFVVNLDPHGGLNKIDLPTLVYHEAEPGHHLQVTRAIARADLPLLRRLINFNAYSEGWAVYAEQLADEMGQYDGDPYGRLGFLRWQIWRAARLVVDTGIHSGHWTREQAIAYLTETTGDTPAVIALEVDRYLTEPGQACGYEIGREEIVQLRDRARAALGTRFDIRDFHDAILGEGELPPEALEARVNAWLASSRASNGGNRSAR